MKSDVIEMSGRADTQSPYDGFVFQRCIAAFHGRQYAVRTRLYRQMYVADQFRQLLDMHRSDALVNSCG